jgi:hypothetical protein
VPSLIRAGATALAIVLAWGGTCPAQSLAELARREQERRKTLKTPSKVYTNESLRRAPPISVAGTPARPPGESAVPPPPAVATRSTPEPAKDEQYWRSRITGARAALERSQLLLEALQSRVNALTTDFVNRDDPAQRALIAEDRQRTLAELERTRADIERLKKDIIDIEEEARRAGVPPGWLR